MEDFLSISINYPKVFCFLAQRSTFDWLHPLGGHLSEIIEQEKEEDIIKLLPALIENYPDIRLAYSFTFYVTRCTNAHIYLILLCISDDKLCLNIL